MAARGGGSGDGGRLRGAARAHQRREPPGAAEQAAPARPASSARAVESVGGAGVDGAGGRRARGASVPTSASLRGGHAGAAASGDDGPPWRTLLPVFRRAEARGEIRGGRFVAGLVGEQFALPEAVEALRRERRTETSGALTTISACDPLNLAGILTPGPLCRRRRGTGWWCATACRWRRCRAGRCTRSTRGWRRRRGRAWGCGDGHLPGVLRVEEAARTGAGKRTLQLPWFYKARTYVERTGRPWFVLSAKYGLVHPDEVIAPYDSP